MIFERKLSDVLCDNFNIAELQKLVFFRPSDKNPAIRYVADSNVICSAFSAEMSTY
jgi:hypothetical protein